MLLQTILNHVQPCKSFCYQTARFEDDAKRIVVKMRARKNGRAICSGCQAKCPGYDRLKERRYEFVPLWNMPVFLEYAPRRVQCPHCGVKVEEVPWAEGKSQHCTVYEWFLAGWAQLLAWQQVARSFGTSWNTVHRAVTAAVLWGLERRSLDGIGAIGVDEIAWQKGHHYLTLVYQIDSGQKRLLHVCEGRTKASLVDFFKTLGQERAEQLHFACSDMWSAYLDVIERYSMAVNILDRFHIMKKMNEAIDAIRRQEMSKARKNGYATVLKNSRWCLLKRRENLTKKQVVKLKELLKYNLPPVKAHLLREDFQRFWTYKTKKWARRFLHEWCARVGPYHILTTKAAPPREAPMERIGMKRCPWAKTDLYAQYHDTEWGVPVHDDRLLFEFLIREGAQAGLSWETILKKRENYRAAFDQFDPATVAKYGQKMRKVLLSNSGIVRNRLKIEAAIQNAKVFLAVQNDFGTFDEYIWGFVGGQQKQNAWPSIKEVPAKTPESDAMSKDLKRRGFKFVGSTICYAFMQAVGMVNDHLIDCFRHGELRKAPSKRNG